MRALTTLTLAATLFAVPVFAEDAHAQPTPELDHQVRTQTRQAMDQMNAQSDLDRRYAIMATLQQLSTETEPQEPQLASR